MGAERHAGPPGPVIGEWQFAARPETVEGKGWKGWIVTLVEGDTLRQFTYNETEGVEDDAEALVAAYMELMQDRDPNELHDGLQLQVRIREVRVLVITDICPN